MNFRLTHPRSGVFACPTAQWSAEAPTAVIVVGGGFEVVGEVCAAETGAKACAFEGFGFEGFGEAEESGKTEALDNSVPEFGPREWLPDMDSNHDKQIQRLLCYHYTIGQPEPKQRTY